MQALLKVFGSIALLRAGPQALPASGFLLALALLLHGLTGLLLGLFSLEPEIALVAALGGTLITVGFVHGLLALRGLAGRALQTLTAMAGCEAMLGLLAAPLTFWFFAVPQTEQVVPGLLSLLLLGWNVAIAGHIFRHALNVSVGIGLLVAIAYTFVSLTLSEFLVPAQ